MISVGTAVSVSAVNMVMVPRSAAAAPPVSMSAVPMGMMSPAPAVVAPAEAEADPADRSAPSDVEAPAEAQAVGNAETESGRPGIIVSADPGRVTVACAVNYYAAVHKAADIAGIVADVNIFGSVVVNSDVAHMVNRIRRRYRIDDARNVDADFPAGDRIQ